MRLPLSTELVCYSASVPDDMPLAVFAARVGTGVRCLERFVDRGMVLFTAGSVHEAAVSAFNVQPATYVVDGRESKVLLLMVKGRRSLTLQAAREIVAQTPLAAMMSEISCVGVRRSAAGARVRLAQAYVHFTSAEAARQAVNCVSAHPVGENFAHAPRLEHGDVSQKQKAVWHNPAVRAESSVETLSVLSGSEHDGSSDGVADDMSADVPELPVFSAIRSCGDEPAEPLGALLTKLAISAARARRQSSN